MKKIKTISLLILIIIMYLGTTVFAITGTVNAPSGLVLREEPNKMGAPLTTIPDKTELEIIEENREWYKVTYSAQTGYVFREFVSKNEETQVEPITTETPALEEQNNIQTKNKIKVYMIPVITSTVIYELEPNAQIKIEKQITNWSYIISGNIQGWVRTYNIKSEEKMSTEESTTEEQNEESVEKPINATESEPEKTIANQPTNNNEETIVKNEKGFVTVNYANIRKEASTNSEIVTTLTKDTSFIITAETEEWYKVTYTGLDETIYEGYIYKDLVTK